MRQISKLWFPRYKHLVTFLLLFFRWTTLLDQSPCQHKCWFGSSNVERLCWIRVLASTSVGLDPATLNDFVESESLPAQVLVWIQQCWTTLLDQSPCQHKCWFGSSNVERLCWIRVLASTSVGLDPAMLNDFVGPESLPAQVLVWIQQCWTTLLDQSPCQHKCWFGSSNVERPCWTRVLASISVGLDPAVLNDFVGLESLPAQVLVWIQQCWTALLDQSPCQHKCWFWSSYVERPCWMRVLASTSVGFDPAMLNELVGRFFVSYVNYNPLYRTRLSWNWYYIVVKFENTKKT